MSIELLHDWDEVKTEYEFSNILVGNGASIAVWDDFRYDSLYHYASSHEISHPINDVSLAIFKELQTQNFEQVLRHISDAQSVIKCLPNLGENLLNLRRLRIAYLQTRRALVETIKSVHIPYALLRDDQLLVIREALASYRCVFSTNYDLIIYWAIVADNNHRFDDGFRWAGLPFDENVFMGSKLPTHVMYLHGGLHLYRISNGDVVKRVAEPGNNLLDLFGKPYFLRSGSEPLFITEGRSEAKIESISQTNYLRWCHKRFAQTQGNLAVFGHALNSEYDQHLIDSINSSDAEVVAISLLRSEQIRLRIAQLKSQLPKKKLVFYDAETHPLGLPDLAVGRPSNNMNYNKFEAILASAQLRRSFGNEPPPWSGLDD